MPVAHEKQGELKYIKVADIRENPGALRTVNRGTEKYLGLVQSISAVGVQAPIQVREIPDRDNPGQIVYGLIDGLHRFSAAQDAGLETIPAHVTSRDDGEVLEAQIMANVHKIETKPSEYSDALLRLLGQNPTLTVSELAKKLAKSPKWLGDRLSITKLHEKIQQLVDENKVNLSNAYALAKLKDPNEQLNFLDRAMTETPGIFVPLITNRVKEINDEKRKGREAGEEKFVAIAHLRKIKDLEDELQSKRAAEQYRGAGKITNVDDFLMGVRYCLSLDPMALEAAERKWNDKKKQREEDKKKAAFERAQKKEADAQKVLAELRAGNGATEQVQVPATAGR